ncbi:MAG: two-component regulator propeller domain-containing protein [Verrucomicrobiota bacterium]
MRATVLNFFQLGRLLLAAGVFLARAAAAAANYQVDVWQADDGLPQGTVTSIAQTEDGYLWLGTQNGLVRFDGINFRVFNENNTPAIKNNRVVQVFADRQGTLWVGAEQGNLIRCQQGRFTSLEMPGRGSAFNYARAFCDDPSGSLWVISCEWQLLHLSRKGFEVPSTNWNLSGSRPDAVACDRGGAVCVGTEKELAVLSPNGFQTLWNQTNEENFEVDFLAASREAGWWVAGNGRLRRFANGKFVADRGAYRWKDRPIYGLYEDSRHRLWVATMGAGLFRYDPDGAVLHLATKDGLPTDFVRCVIEDREGNIWAGMEGGGLCRLKPRIFETIGAPQGLSSDQVLSGCEAGNGDFWIGMNGSGIDRLQPGGVEHYDSRRGLMNGHTWSILEDRAGFIWAGTWGGLFKLDHDQFVNVSDGNQIGGVVLALFEDSAGNLWVGQQAFGVLACIHQDERTAIHIPGTSASLDVRTLAEDLHGDLWVGTENEGLYRRQGANWFHFGKREGLENESIWSLYADGGALWIGTCGGGLSCWRDGKMKSWTTRNGLVNDVICQILDDGRGNLWLGSYGGVFRVSKSELDHAPGGREAALHCVSYKRADGLPSIECQGGFQPSGFKSRDGRLWFPTGKGFAVVNPEQIATNLVPPIVLAEDLLVDNVAQVAEGRNALEIPAGRNRLEFHYTATSLTAPEKVRFKYRLEGLDKEWQEAGSRRTATYSRLAPGNYSFHVIACNNDGIWNEQGARLAIIVLPLFWQTGWFLMLSAVILVAAVFTAVRFVVTRRLHLKLARLEREQMVQRERARIAKDIHDDLGASLTEIAILSELAQNPDTPALEARADLRKIAAKTGTLTQLLDEIVWAVNPQRDTLENFVTYTCTYAENFLHVAQIQCRLQLPPAVPEISLRTDVRHGLFLVVKEALNNVVKHAAASEVQLRMDLLPADFTISIRDNGRGFSVPPPAASQPDGAGGTVANGDGLGNMRHRIESLGGRFEIFSRPGEGTQVRLNLPINP